MYRPECMKMYSINIMAKSVFHIFNNEIIKFEYRRNVYLLTSMSLQTYIYLPYKDSSFVEPTIF